LVLRQQIRILERRLGKSVRASRVEKLMLAVVALQFRERTQAGHKRLKEAVLIFRPATVLKWHRELVKRKWTFHRPARVGKPRIESDLEALIVRLASEKPGLGYEKLQGELLKLGYDLGISTVRDVLKRHGISTRAGLRPVAQQLADLPQPLPDADAGVRLLHDRNGLVEDRVRLVFHRLEHAPGVLGWLHLPPRLGVGDSTSQADGVATPGSSDPGAIPHPRPRYQVCGWL
jgi:hypothetical protein